MSTCNQCGRLIADEEIGMGFNMGFGPVYVCNVCHPPQDAEQVMKRIAGFIESVEDRPTQPEKKP